jgi:hypothetical protein
VTTTALNQTDLIPAGHDLKPKCVEKPPIAVEAGHYRLSPKRARRS